MVQPQQITRGCAKMAILQYLDERSVRSAPGNSQTNPALQSIMTDSPNRRGSRQCATRYRTRVDAEPTQATQATQATMFRIGRPENVGLLVPPRLRALVVAGKSDAPPRRTRSEGVVLRERRARLWFDLTLSRRFDDGRDAKSSLSYRSHIVARRVANCLPNGQRIAARAAIPAAGSCP